MWLHWTVGLQMKHTRRTWIHTTCTFWGQIQPWKVSSQRSGLMQQAGRQAHSLQGKNHQGYNTQESHNWKQQLAIVLRSTPCVSLKLLIAPGSSVRLLPFLNLNICLLFSSGYLSDCSCQDNDFINTSTSAHLSWASLPFTITSRKSVARNNDFWYMASVVF